jgi:hypothetical protein
MEFYSILKRTKQMNRAIFHMLLIVLAVVAMIWVGIYVSIYFMYRPDDVVIVKIFDLSKEQEIELPFEHHEGWVHMTHEVIENTALDSVFLGSVNLIPPSWTGVIYANDHYNVEPYKGKYKPIRPVKGSITVKYSVTY